MKSIADEQEQRKRTTRGPLCPVAITGHILGMRWTLQIIHNLRQPRRFCELQKVVGNVNPTTLSQRLKFLETQAVLRRLPISDAPLHVEYELTDKGQELLPILDALARWANKWAALPPDSGEDHHDADCISS